MSCGGHKTPLTDPTSLIAYRLAHGETGQNRSRPGLGASAIAGVFALGIAAVVAAIIALLALV
jgi:hypothetical protein